MEMKKIFLIFFLLFNILSLVNAQDHSESTSSSVERTNTQTSTQPRSVETPSTLPPTIDPSYQGGSTNVIPESKTLPTIPNTIQDTTIIINSSTTVSTNTLSTTLPTKTTTTTTKKATSSKNYPQETFVPWNKSENKEMRTADVLMTFYYILSAAIISIFLGIATFILYKKGIDESPSIQPSKVWETSLDDNSFRNKSTISRSTLTPSVKNSTLPNPNNSQQN